MGTEKQPHDGLLRREKHSYDALLRREKQPHVGIILPRDSPKRRAVHMARAEISGFALQVAKKNSRVESRYARFDPRNRSGSRSRYFLIYDLTSDSQ